MTTNQLVQEINKKKSFLCIGLDVDLNKIPQHLLEEEDPIFAFNKAIIDATHHLCVAYKPNTAFYEAYGIKGWKSLEKTINYLNEKINKAFISGSQNRVLKRFGINVCLLCLFFLSVFNIASNTYSPFIYFRF